MKLINSPNAWSCTLASAAMAFDYPINDLMTLINHNGSEKIHPQLPPPACYKGFHMQEIVDVGLMLGYSLTRVEALPVQTPDGVAEHTIEKWGLFTSGVARFTHYLEQSSGILIGKSRQWWHSCAYGFGTVYDPRGRVCPVADCNLILESLWIVSQDQIFFNRIPIDKKIGP
jgi:hypothetical protein